MGYGRLNAILGYYFEAYVEPSLEEIVCCVLGCFESKISLEILSSMHYILRARYYRAPTKNCVYIFQFCLFTYSKLDLNSEEYFLHHINSEKLSA
jgi:hypothetical protein